MVAVKINLSTMLTNAQEKLIKSLHTKKGRKESGLCLVEGLKFVESAGDFVEYRFTDLDSQNYKDLITTETPQDISAIAKKPVFSIDEILAKPTILILDGVQEPGNVGSILRLALGFDASVILIESADPSNSKSIRSSAGAYFSVPSLEIKRGEIAAILEKLQRPLFRLEKREGSISPKALPHQPLAIIVGSEGKGITLPIEAPSLAIQHDEKLESLSVSHAVAILLYERAQNR